MSVDTYLKRKNTSKYGTLEHQGVRVLVSPLLAHSVRSVHIGMRRALLWKSFSIQVEPIGEHFHGPACRH